VGNVGNGMCEVFNAEGRITMTKILTPQEVEDLIGLAEAELNLCNEIERSFDAGGKPPDRLISFDQHIENTSQLYATYLSLRSVQKELTEKEAEKSQRDLAISDLKRELSEKEKEIEGWHGVVVDCERALKLEGTAESPLNSNLTNAVRDKIVECEGLKRILDKFTVEGNKQIDVLRSEVERLTKERDTYKDCMFQSDDKAEKRLQELTRYKKEILSAVKLLCTEDGFEDAMKTLYALIGVELKDLKVRTLTWDKLLKLYIDSTPSDCIVFSKEGIYEK
jgi:hypothetical protein